MKKIKETKGVTLIALVVTIVVLLILASIGINSGQDAINSAKFNEFKSELKIMQTKVNELNQSNETEIRPELTEQQKSIFNVETVYNIIFENKSDEEITNIKKGFRYYSKDYINNKFNFDSITRDYFVNIEKRIVISCTGFEYKGKTYYMSEQFTDGLYNVEYNNKNTQSGSYDINTIVEENRCKIEISNIHYEGYINDWQVKYKLKDSSQWKTSNDLSFYVKEDGTYDIEVVHGNEISLGAKEQKIITGGTLVDKVKNNTIKIGDYIKYEADSADTSEILNELVTYSGTDTNTANTLKQEKLNWRVLDVEDGKVRLISDGPTTSTIALSGYNGYNNAVYLLDHTCKTLYSNSTLSSNVQNLKIEDIQDKMIEKDYSKITSKYGTVISPMYKYYPDILLQEKNQIVTLNENLNNTKLELSEQTELIEQNDKQICKSWNLKYTYWDKVMEEGDFDNLIYYNLFINNGNEYKRYWLSSRCIEDVYDYAIFGVRLIISGKVYDGGVYNSNERSFLGTAAFRPVITLNSSVKLDITDIGDGSSPQTGYSIK